jgi:hypothetical protein
MEPMTKRLVLDLLLWCASLLILSAACWISLR